jgi:hypothetical protein
VLVTTALPAPVLVASGVVVIVAGIVVAVVLHLRRRRRPSAAGQPPLDSARTGRRQDSQRTDSWPR